MLHYPRSSMFVEIIQFLMRYREKSVFIIIKLKKKNIYIYL